jgi:dTDP-glucose 4,6-dehydratase
MFFIVDSLQTGMEKLVPRIIAQPLAGTSLPDYGDGRNVRDWLRVEDCGRGIEAVLKQRKDP